jgi:hypothetical protein
MSLDARNSFAGALVFTAWKGRQVVRQLVTPANPMSTDQNAQRTYVRVMGLGQHWAQMTAKVLNGQTEVDRVRLRDAAPPGQAWNGYLVKSGIGVANANWDAAEVAWAALTGGEKTAWTNAAAAQTPAFPASATIVKPPANPVAIVAGNVYFHYMWALYMAGLYTQPNATPPTYA